MSKSHGHYLLQRAVAECQTPQSGDDLGIEVSGCYQRVADTEARHDSASARVVSGVEDGQH
ncbi:MAG: hypothetical protein M0Z95_09180 [Actinomycetota bacterium]|nr:hypothetical protein [Actinomycetota bacterium]